MLIKYMILTPRYQSLKQLLICNKIGNAQGDTIIIFDIDKSSSMSCIQLVDGVLKIRGD